MSPVPQHMEALAKANHFRLERARIKDELRQMSTVDGWRRCGRLVADPPPELATMLVVDLLKACHRMGPGRAERMLRVLGVSLAVSIGRLTPRQVGALTVALGAAGPGHVSTVRRAVEIREAIEQEHRPFVVFETYCSTCEKDVVPVDGRCGWCSTVLNVNQGGQIDG